MYVREMEVGDLVYIRKSSKYYGANARANPAEQIGVVTFINVEGDLPYQVTWLHSEARNVYGRGDLRYARGATSPATRLKAESILLKLGARPDVKAKSDVPKKPVTFEECIAYAKATVQRGWSVAHYAFVYKNKEVAENTNRACHAQVLGIDGSKLHSIVTLIRRTQHQEETQEVAKRFMCWLIERSPWKDAFIESGEEAWDSWFATVTPGCPANIVQGALIASRQTRENMERIVTWDKLVAEGVPENDAFVIASCVYRDDRDTLSTSLHSGGHYPINPYIMGTNGFKAFCAGEHLFLSDKLSERGDTRKVHATFAGGRNSLEVNIENIIEECGKSKKVVVNPFAKAKPGKGNRKTASIKDFASYYLKKGI